MKRRTRVHKTREWPSAELKAASTTAAVLNSASCMNRPAAKWAWHYRTLLSVRDRLVKERNERLREAAQSLETHSLDIADTATDEFDHDRTLSELSAKQDVLYEVDEAIKRILNSTYGVCEETGKPIPSARLKAIPWTRFAKEVEWLLEGKGLVGRPHLGALGSVRGEPADALEQSQSEEGKPPPPPEDETLRKVFKPPIDSDPKRVAPHSDRRPRIAKGANL